MVVFQIFFKNKEFSHTEKHKQVFSVHEYACFPGACRRRFYYPLFFQAWIVFICQWEWKTRPSVESGGEKSALVDAVTVIPV